MSSSTSSETYLHSHSITHTWTVHNCGKLRLRNKVSLCSSPFPAQWDEPRFQIWLTTDVDYYGYETASCFVETKSTLQGSYSLALKDPTGRDIAQVTCNTKTAARITCEKKALLGFGGNSASTASVVSAAACSGDDNDRFALVVLFRFEYMTDRNGGQEECPGSPLLGQLPGLLESASFGDVEIRVGQKKLRAHGDLLGRLSPVFAAMLTGPTAEAANRVVVIEDLSYEAVRQLLEFLYAGTLSGISQGAVDLYVAADKYGVASVKAACARQLSNALAPDNAVRVFELAVRHSDKELSRDAARFIDAHLPEVQASDAWDALLHDDLMALALFKSASRYQPKGGVSSASSSTTAI
ncbi:speckle-type POZ protein-like [Amblyomma americanum]